LCKADEILRWYAQRVRNYLDASESRIQLSPLDLADVVAMKAGLVTEFLLRHFSFLAQATNRQAEPNVQRLFGPGHPA
jgi:hypothetical protein